MGERKVLNKYIPSDFDPSLIPRGKKLSAKDGTVPVRMMLPFSIQCSTCQTFLYRGRKFNSKKEPMGGPDGTYLGITRFRFYIKCTQCARPISFLTDPQNADYEMENGGTRNFEYTRDKNAQEAQHLEEKEKSEKDDPIAALEERVLDSQREMADLDNLEEIKAMNQKHLQLLSAGKSGEAREFGAETAAVLEASRGKAAHVNVNEDGLTAEDEALVKSIQFGKRPPTTDGVLRLDENDEARAEALRRQELAEIEARSKNQQQREKRPNVMPLIKVKRKRAVESDNKDSKQCKSTPPSSEVAETSVSSRGTGLSGLLGGYSSDSDSN